MAKKSIEQVNKAIQEKEAELNALKQEKRKAAENPERLIYLRRKERRINETLEGLKRAKAAAEYTPPEPTDKDLLLSGLKEYERAKAEKVAKAAADVQAAKSELNALESALNKAAAACDTEKIIELSEKKEGAESKVKYLIDAQKRVDALPVYPDGAIYAEWQEVCADLLPDWKERVAAVETMAQAYKEACSSLLTMYDTIQAAKTEFERTAAKEGTFCNFPPAFSMYLNPASMTIDKVYHARFANMAQPITGKAL